jgi:Holliday junction DNA helicase RuvA
VFELLQTASGVGPRLALAMLAVFSPDGLRRAVSAEDIAALIRVPGIGKKGAQRIVLELAGRLGAPSSGAGQEQAVPAGSTALATGAWREQVRTGLLGLGWQARDAELAIDAVEADLAEEARARAAAGDAASDEDRAEPDVAAMLRAALRKLSRA